METQMGIDSETLGLALIDKGDAVEAVLNLLSQRLRGIAQMLAKEVIVNYVLLVLTLKTDGMVGMEGIEAFWRTRWPAA